ncbi:MAG: head-tail connector protein [Rhizobiaceae bacterium]
MTKMLVTPPAGYPVSLEAMKTHLRVTQEDDDGYLQELVAAATAHVEAITGLSLLEQDWRVFLDDLPQHWVTLPLRPVLQITQVRHFNLDGDPTILPPTEWILDNASDPPRFALTQVSGLELPCNGLEIDMTVGFGSTGTDVPDTIRRAILLLVAQWYEVRGATSDAAVTAIEPPGLHALLRPWRRVSL